MKRNDFIGWVGVLLILTSFILTTFGVINASNLTYGLLNFTGAIGIAVSSYAKKDFQPVLLNLVWLLVASVGIARSLLHF